MRIGGWWETEAFMATGSSFSERACPAAQRCPTPRTAARQAPLSVGFPRQEHWSGLPCSPPGDPPDPGTEPCLTDWQTPYCQCRLGSLRDFWGDSKRRRKGFDGTGVREEGWLAFRAGTEEVSSSHVRKAKLRESIWKGAWERLFLRTCIFSV